MQKVITVVLDHSQLFINATSASEIEHPELKTQLEKGFKVKDTIPITTVQETNAGISIIAFILDDSL